MWEERGKGKKEDEGRETQGRWRENTRKEKQVYMPYLQHCLKLKHVCAWGAVNPCISNSYTGEKKPSKM